LILAHDFIPIIHVNSEDQAILSKRNSFFIEKKVTYYGIQIIVYPTGSGPGYRDLEWFFGGRNPTRLGTRRVGLCIQVEPYFEVLAKAGRGARMCSGDLQLPTPLGWPDTLSVCPRLT